MSSLGRLVNKLGIGHALDQLPEPKVRGGPELHEVKRIPQGRKSSDGGKGRGARNLIRDVVRRTPEVMVKVSSVGKDAGRVLAHLTYITRNGKIDAENERGEFLDGLDDVKAVHESWVANSGKQRSNGKLSVNVMLSMPAGTNPARMKEAVRLFAAEAFKDHEYVFALHTPETDPHDDAPAHPHVHISVKARGRQGQRLVHGREELQQWRELFATKLRERGIDAAATPREVRGVVKKGKRQAVYKASRAKRSTVELAAMQEAARAVLDGQAPDRTTGPWDEHIQANQKAIREGWTTLAKIFNESDVPGDKELGREIQKFVDDMGPADTRRQEMEKKMKETLAKRVRDSEAQQPEARKGQGSTQQNAAQDTPRKVDKDLDRE